MSDPRGPVWSDPTESSGYPPNTDPAYGQYPAQYWGQTYYGPGYSGGEPYTGGQHYTGPVTQPTEQLPYWQPSGYQQTPPPPPPQPPKSPRWLWALAAAATLLVAGLVLALVIVSSSSKDSKIAAPVPQTTPTSRPTTSTRAPMPTTTTRIPLPTTTIRPEPSTTTEPTTPILPGEPSTTPTGSETVVYTVIGEGRAINITYIDSGGVLQTEFNVALPWSKQVSLAAPAKNSASVTVVNVGRDVTCSVTVNGAQVRQRTGQGLTICAGFA